MRGVLCPARLLALLFLTLCFFASVIRSEPQDGPGAPRIIQEVDAVNGGYESEHVRDGRDSYQSSFPSEQDGAQLVSKALTILRSIEASKSRYARLEKSSVLSTTAYWAKELFFLLFMNGPPPERSANARQDPETLSGPLLKAVNILKSAAKVKNADAIYLLADLNFHGNYSHPRNYSTAFRRYRELASTTGNSTAQHMVGFMYATGIGGSVKRDQAKALLYHTFAALGGNTKSEMTVAYRHHSRIGTAKDCEKASYYYRKVAGKAMQYWRSGPPGGRIMARDAYRMADEEGGVYGEGASASSAGHNAPQGGPHSDSNAALDDVLEYLDLLSGKGEFKATFSLGKLYYEGRRSLTRDPKKAKGYFLKIAKRFWARDGKTIQGGSADLEEVAAKAAAYLGRLYMDGEGVEQNFDKARMWFRRGVVNGDRIAQWGMGLLYLRGLGVPQDAMKAAEYFKVSADQEWGPAQVNMGKLFLDQGDVQLAATYFELAVRMGNLEAYYHLADMYDQGIGRDRSCPIATAYYKMVAERVEPLHSDFGAANDAYRQGDLETALVSYMMAAEQGYEAAQANVAFLLDEQKSKLPLDALLPLRRARLGLLRDPTLALIYWTRSAKQSNLDSAVKVGDYHLAGIGTDADESKAASCYQSAADSHLSAQAQWNLGWMHENGIGVEQDFHLAKRFYDQALETNQEAYLPVSLALLKLRVRSYWNTITNGRIKSIQDDPEPTKEWSFREWVHRFVEDDYRADYNEYDDDDLTNPIHEQLLGGEDLYDDAVDDGLLESFIIVGLAAALAFLVYYRQQRQLRHQREADRIQAQAQQAAGPLGAPAAAPQGDAAQQQPQDRGFFPRPGDPEYGQWVAGGMMH